MCFRSYRLAVLVGGLFLSLLMPTAFGSLPSQENGQDTFDSSFKRGSSTAPTMELIFPVPFEIQDYIFSFLSQDDSLRIGSVSKSWRKAASQIWEKRALDLSEKSLKAADYMAIATGIFPRLKLNEVKLDNTGARILATCSHLHALSLRSNHLQFTPALGALLARPSLTSIDLSNTRIGDTGLSALEPAFMVMTSLKELKLYFNQLRAIPLASVLKAVPSLTALDLASNSIEAEEITAFVSTLKFMTALRLLDLKYNSIWDKGAEALAFALEAMTALTSLDLSYTRIGNEGARALAQSLPKMMSLRKLKFEDNQVRDEGVRDLAQSLTEMAWLRKFYFKHNQIGDEGGRVLEELKRSRPFLRITY